MNRSRPKHYGYLLVDHRASPGIPGEPGMGPGSVFEADTIACNHCSVPVVMNPLRQRERFFCPRCNQYCCDICAAAYHVNKVCKPFECVADEVVSGSVPFPLFAKDLKG